MNRKKRALFRVLMLLGWWI